ncbi:MAG: ATP synthase F1 subunit delta [Flavobacteriales bacterium]|jgi:F-type H+-transporting ATPase subunit delta|nr:ATP synthase F1 subunit delta [Flavobacteriales bacterium]MBP7450123.1 ATP synthase F1 subunit delta [Flavobacteriales bacterium]HOZ39398.1 ATP synthase F1 subunit delta [Flavobacteriales bacterium]
MIVAPVAYRYARSLMELAQEKGVLAGVHEDMRLVGSTCAANRELVVLLNSPVVKADKKDRILEQVFAGKVGQLTATFMGILVRKGRERLLPDVAHAFSELYKISKNIVVAHVSSAVPLSAGARAKVLAIAEKQHPGKSIELVEKVDPALIGGVTIRIGDELYDGTVSRRLADLRREFSKNPYIPAI